MKLIKSKRVIPEFYIDWNKQEFCCDDLKKAINMNFLKISMNYDYRRYMLELNTFLIGPDQSHHIFEKPFSFCPYCGDRFES